METHVFVRYKRFQSTVAQCYPSEKLRLSLAELQVACAEVSREMNYS